VHMNDDEVGVTPALQRDREILPEAHNCWNERQENADPKECFSAPGYQGCPVLFEFEG
jgi:hypothetical protein